MADTATAVAPGGSTTTTDTQNAPGGGQQPVASPGSGGTVAEKTYSFREDRSDWIPRNRLNDTNAKHERELKEMRDRIDQQTNRVKQAFGVETPTKEQSDANELREALYQLIPGLKNLEGLTKEELDEVREAAATARSSTVSQWERVAETMVTDVEDQIAEAYGADKLTATQQRGIRRAYREEAQLSVNERKKAYARGERDTLETLRTDTDFLARHERQDKTLIKEFVKGYLDDWFVPARRSAAADTFRRQRPVPGGERTRTSVTTKQPEIDYNDDNAFKRALLEARASS